MSGDWLGALALALALANGGVLLLRIRRVSLARGRDLHVLGWALALALGVAALAQAPHWPAKLAGAVGALIGAMNLGLRLGSPQSPRAPAVRVGGPLLDFTAPDADGGSFSLAGLAGRPLLLKFFRGHW